MKNLLSSMKYSFAIILCLASWSSIGQTNFDTVQVRPLNISGNIYMLKGAGGNIGVITGPDGTAIVDDQFLPLGNKIKEAIQKLDDHPVRFTINTHIHGDHSGGNEFFKQQGSLVIAQDVVRERMMKEQVDKKSGKTAPPRHKDAWPLLTFPEKMNLHLNGQDVELIHFGAGHTDGDVIVRFKQADVWHMGDVFVTYGYPYIDLSNGGTLSGMVATLDKVLPLMNNSSKIIPGHGNLCTKEDVKKYRDKLADIRDKVLAALKDGKKVEELTGLGITDPYDKEWGGALKGRDFILIAAEDFKPKN